MSSDPAQFIPPERYPSPPKNTGYQAPNNPPADRPKTIFPWETYQSKPTRVFSQPGQSPPRPAKQAPSTPPPSSRPQTPRSRSVSSVSTAVEPQTPPSAKHKPWGPLGATYTRTPPATFPTRVSRPKSSDGWSSFPRTNAWDDVPEINRYIERRVPWYLRGGASIQTGGGGDDEDETPVPITHRRGSRITEFPSDRPSLPVTPAPVGRPRWQRSGWEDDWEEGEQHAHERLAGAEGVPAQTDWVCVHGIRWCPEDCLCDLANVLHYYKDPAERLRKLAQEQSEALIKRLGTEQQDTKEEGRRETPRAEAGLVSPVPVRPPTPGAQGDVVERITSGLSGLGLGLGLAPPTGLAPPESEVVPSSAASTTYYSAFSSPKLTETSSPTLVAAVPPSRIAASLAAVAAQQEKELQQRQGSLGIQEPSYRGPGAAFEKGEDVPKFETPALPTEEELDVLET
jgi:glycogenin glucosyltransferase